ncbi:MAG: hypothetical protein ABIE74_08340, partial [Pseudomonadota bacterium]
RCEVIGNKMYGLFVHEDANLSIKSMKSMIGNGDGKSALNAFTPNSNIGLIKAIQDKETFVVPESAVGGSAARYIELYKVKEKLIVQPEQLLVRRELNPIDLAQKGDSLTITDPAIRGQYLIAMVTGGDGSTLSIDTLLAKDRVIITATDTISLPTAGGEGFGGVSTVDPASPSSIPSDGSGSGLGAGMGAVSGMGCALVEDGCDYNSIATSTAVFWFFVTFISAIRSVRKKKLTPSTSPLLRGSILNLLKSK